MPEITIRGKHAIVLYTEDGTNKSRIMRMEIPPQNHGDAEGGTTDKCSQ